MQSRRDICPRCSKAVYAAEMVLGPERKSYHKLCLSCTSCRSRLAPGSFQEHDGEPYCRNCHRRLFAPRDLRSANLPSTDKATSVDDPAVGVVSSPPKAARVTTRAPEGEADLTPRESDNNNPVAGRRATITAKEDEDSEEGKEAINPSNVDTTGVLSRSAGPSTNVISPMITGSPLSSPSGPRRSFGGVRVECPRCKKAVYQAEQVRA
ncbi:hypothetical protein DL93DRAFT_298229 [Clavulina sp. PMI_390]|nr:hypothetical protein DL93DRAFT_298229 [Clavulina sp. PMI_390]